MLERYKEEILAIIHRNDNTNHGQVLQEGRNTVTMHILSDGKKVVIKAFKIPNLINKIAYKYFRKSKAKRSFEFASRLVTLNIGTPKPVLYIRKI